MGRLPAHWISTCIDNLKYHVQRCIQRYMTLEETMNYLQEKHKINGQTMTKPVWERLENQNPDFFKNYYLRCEIVRQKKMFNYLLMKQLAMMLEQGHITISNASPKLVRFLSEDPEGIRLWAKTSPNMPSSSSSSPPLPNTNGPTVNQLQIPSGQQNQLHPCPLLTSNPYYNIGAPAIAPVATNPSSTPNEFSYPTGAPVATDQWSNDLAGYLPGGPIVAPATTDPWPTLDELAFPTDLGAHTAAQATTITQLYPSTLDPGSDIGHSSHSLEEMNIHFPEQELMHLETQFQELNEQYLQYGGDTNGLQNINQYPNFDPNEWTQMYTSVDQEQQPQEVMLHPHPEIHEVGPYQSSDTDALNNLDNGNGTLTAAQN